MSNGPFNFKGNIELGIYYGYADVMVCDGFTGNIILKLTEVWPLSKFIEAGISRNVSRKVTHFC